MTATEPVAVASGQKSSKTRDRNRLVAALAIDIAIAALAAARDGNFLTNFAFFWLPHPPLLMILWWFKPRIHALIGNVCGLAVATSLFGVLGALRPDTGFVFWSWYWIAMPGAAVGGIIGYTLIPARKQQSSRKIILLTCIGTVVGTLISLWLGLTIIRTEPGGKNDNKRQAPARRRSSANDDAGVPGVIDYRLAIIEYRISDPS